MQKKNQVVALGLGVLLGAWLVAHHISWCAAVPCLGALFATITVERWHVDVASAGCLAVASTQIRCGGRLVGVDAKEESGNFWLMDLVALPLAILSADCVVLCQEVRLFGCCHLRGRCLLASKTLG